MSLSDKIEEGNYDCQYSSFIFVEDVKEFIKELKDKLFSLNASSPLFFEIDKLAGEKLI